MTKRGEFGRDVAHVRKMTRRGKEMQFDKRTSISETLSTVSLFSTLGTYIPRTGTNPSTLSYGPEISILLEASSGSCFRKRTNSYPSSETMRRYKFFRYGRGREPKIPDIGIRSSKTKSWFEGGTPSILSISCISARLRSFSSISKESKRR